MAIFSASVFDRLRIWVCAIVRFFSTVRCGKRLKFWKHIPMCVRTLSRSQSGSVISSSPMKTLPPVGVSSMLTQRSSVDFPEPDGPMTHTTSPG